MIACETGRFRCRDTMPSPGACRWCSDDGVSGPAQTGQQHGHRLHCPAGRYSRPSTGRTSSTRASPRRWIMPGASSSAALSVITGVRSGASRASSALHQALSPSTGYSWRSAGGDHRRCATRCASAPRRESPPRGDLLSRHARNGARYASRSGKPPTRTLGHPGPAAPL